MVYFRVPKFNCYTHCLTQIQEFLENKMKDLLLLSSRPCSRFPQPIPSCLIWSQLTPTSLTALPGMVQASSECHSRGHLLHSIITAVQSLVSPSRFWALEGLEMGHTWSFLYMWHLEASLAHQKNSVYFCQMRINAKGKS